MGKAKQGCPKENRIYLTLCKNKCKTRKKKNLHQQHSAAPYFVDKYMDLHSTQK